MRAAEAWPQQLADTVGVTVYDMGVGGFGAMHHLQRLDKALALGPEVIVLALYTGNDLFDAVHVRGLMEPVGAMPAARRDSMAQLEAAQPLAEQAEAFAIPVLVSMPDVPEGIAWLRLARLGARGVWAVRRLQSTRGDADDQWARLTAMADADTTLVGVDGEAARTVMTPHRRYVALNLDDARIREGQRLSTEAIRQFIERCMAARVMPVVVTIPTREWAYDQLASRLPFSTACTISRPQCSRRGRVTQKTPGASRSTPAMRSGRASSAARRSIRCMLMGIRPQRDMLLLYRA